MAPLYSLPCQPVAKSMHIKLHFFTQVCAYTLKNNCTYILPIHNRQMH